VISHPLLLLLLHHHHHHLLFLSLLLHLTASHISGNSPHSIEIVFLAANIHVARHTSQSNIFVDMLIWVEGEAGPIAPEWTEHCFSEVTCDV
jgi:hypothetical protein